MSILLLNIVLFIYFIKYFIYLFIYFLRQQEFLVYGYFRQRWKDMRLAGKLNRTLTLKGTAVENMWLPDPYCYNARESNMMMLDTQLHSKIAVDPNGDILYSKG